MRTPSFAVLAAALLAFAGPAIAAETPPAPAFPHVAWSRDANIYEVNIRQDSPAARPAIPFPLIAPISLGPD